MNFPEHYGTQEQDTTTEKGTLEFTIDGEKVILSVDDLCSIPANVPHSTTAGKERAVTISIFTPVKEDVIIKPEY